jgi:hypothetical protein
MARAMIAAQGEGKASAAVGRPPCGILMPSSAIAGCSEAHWTAVLDIVRTAAKSAGFEPALAPAADEVGAIEKRIMRTREDDSIAVCDVSGKDPDVLFELGLRLAFDKPTIIIKDDVTSYLVDGDAIGFLEYPRDLNSSGTAEFRSRLARTIQSTYKKAAADRERATMMPRSQGAKSSRAQTGKRGAAEVLETQETS